MRAEPLAFAFVMLALVACGRSGFEPSFNGDEAHVPVPRGFPGSGAATSPPPSPTPSPFCDPANADLVGCWRFEGSASDGSSFVHPASAQNVSYQAGVDGDAIELAAGSNVAISDDPVFDGPDVTVEAWIRPNSLPSTGTRMAVMDLNGTYGLFVQSNAALTCGANGVATVTTTAGAVAVGAWTHVACTYDGAQLAVWVHGKRSAAVNATNPLTVTSDDLRIGENGPGGDDQLLGRIDSLRMWRVVRTEAEICAAAGC